jgi:hypothetical protein
MPNRKIPVHESITELQVQVEQFRAAHPPRTRLPKPLWQSAVELARSHGMLRLPNWAVGSVSGVAADGKGTIYEGGLCWSNSIGLFFGSRGSGGSNPSAPTTESMG